MLQIGTKVKIVFGPATGSFGVVREHHDWPTPRVGVHVQDNPDQRVVCDESSLEVQPQ